MTRNTRPQGLRRLIVAALLISGMTVMTAQAAPPAALPDEPPQSAGQGDWDFLVGDWNVKHRRLKARLAGSTEWEEFNGTSKLWLTLGGLGTADDNLLELPGGTYRAVGVRAFDAKSRQWSIWWLDARSQTIDPPVRGGFKDGVGTFVGDDVLRDKPIKVRFRWSEITANSARWEQAFSPDGGKTWEVNWVMHFTRAAG